MLEGLNEIDWARVRGHIYGEPEAIPSHIWNLLSEDFAVRQEALGFLLGSGQDMGEIADSTPLIIPFLLEILADSGTPHRSEVLYYLGFVAQHAAGRAARSFRKKRLQVYTYEALERAIDLLLRLLDDQDAETRFESIVILRSMADSAEQIIPALINHFGLEDDPAIRVEIVKSIVALLSAADLTQGDLRKRYTPFFERLAAPGGDPALRVVAARAALMVMLPYRFIQQTAPPDLVETVIEAFWAVKDGDMGSYFEKRDLVMALSRVGPAALLPLLDDPRLSARDAHLVARGLLARALTLDVINGAHWDYLDDAIQWNQPAIHYTIHPLAVTPPPPQGQGDAALRALIAHDRFWELPSNLLSFFYGLPDSREALRALLERSAAGGAGHLEP